MVPGQTHIGDTIGGVALGFSLQIGIAAHTVLETVVDAHIQIRDQMQLQGSRQLVTEILQGILRLDMLSCLLVFIQVGIGYAERLQELLGWPQLMEMDITGCFNAHGVHLRMVHAFPYRISHGGVENPVDHVPAMMMEHAGTGSNRTREVFHPAFHGMQFLGFQVFVGLMTAYAIVQFRERRHAQRGVIRGIYLPMVPQSIAHI